MSVQGPIRTAGVASVWFIPWAVCSLIGGGVAHMANLAYALLFGAAGIFGVFIFGVMFFEYGSPLWNWVAQGYESDKRRRRIASGRVEQDEGQLSLPRDE